MPSESKTITPIPVEYLNSHIISQVCVQVTKMFFSLSTAMVPGHIIQNFIKVVRAVLWAGFNLNLLFFFLYFF